MTYQETLNYLFNQVPMFQREGATAYKPGLHTSEVLDDFYGNPHKAFKSIHIAGTNGKGSTSHILASILQEAGYKVGLFTSPHLIDFRERIKVNGKMIPEANVIEFVEQFLSSNTKLKPSFFELTMTMAFDYFRKSKIDYAIIEVGLGGRLDSTNIISPLLSIITNISFDHTQFLGTTLAQIASEKAGIIKPNIPVVIGEAESETRKVFETKAVNANAPIIFSQDYCPILNYVKGNDITYQTKDFGEIHCNLVGDYQIPNAATVLTAIKVLSTKCNFNLPIEAVQIGFRNVLSNTGFFGRWTILKDSPKVICDTGHNIGGLSITMKQLAKMPHNKLHMIIGFVNDKDVSHILPLFPTYAQYYFTQAAIPRALDATKLSEIAKESNLYGNVFHSVSDAYDDALSKANDNDIIFVGGSTFIVADFLKHKKEETELL